MSILRSMSIGLSGMSTNSQAMGIISNNIANVNTVGYKGSRANFSEVFASTAMGVGVSSLQQDFSQGALEATGNVTDLAVSGAGFLVVKGDVNGRPGTYYTRAGQFTIGKEGYVANAQGMRLQGYGISENGELSGNVGDLDVGNRAAPPSATSQVTTKLNLNAEADPVAAFDPTNPLETSNYSTTVTIYDEVGRATTADVYYRKVDAPPENEWEYFVYVPGESVEGGNPGDPPVQIAGGLLQFDTDGRMLAHTPDPDPTLEFVPAHQTGAPVALELEFDISATQYVGPSDMQFQQQNGYAVGELRGLQIHDDGMIWGSFSNGETLLIGQVAMANFRAPEGLDQVSGNLWRASDASGEVLMGVPGVGGRGGLISGALEGSNVDLAHEFVKMIATQRGFQANSKTIQTGDQLLQEIMTLKR